MGLCVCVLTHTKKCHQLKEGRFPVSSLCGVRDHGLRLLREG